MQNINDNIEDKSMKDEFENHFSALTSTPLITRTNLRHSQREQGNHYNNVIGSSQNESDDENRLSLERSFTTNVHFENAPTTRNEISMFIKQSLCYIFLHATSHFQF
jgi:hypothetical protein